MKKYLFLILTTLLLSNCVNLKDHYSLAVCGNKACEYKAYQARGKVLLDTKYDYDYKKVLSLAVNKSKESCLVGYAVVPNHFPADQDVFKFHWDANIQADYILYIRLETFEELNIEPPFNVTKAEQGKFGPYETAFIFFYVEKSRAVSCYKLK